MKKFAKTLIAMTIVTVSVMLLSLGVSAADTPEYLPGDLNGDGLVNTTDVVYLRRYIAGGYGIELKPAPGTNCPTNEVIDPAVAPTCTATGLTEGKHCGSCGTVLVKQEIVPAKGHQYANGICTGCGQTEPTVANFTYTVNDDGKTCTITGVAEGTDPNMVIPEKIDGLLLSGRNISGTHIAHSNYRVMPICCGIGEAAGIAAAIAAKKQIMPREVRAEEIQAYLVN
jgi:hypothetical protein